jgi:hypothetical protein
LSSDFSFEEKYFIVRVRFSGYTAPMEQTVYVRTSKAKILAIIRQLSAAACGNVGEAGQVAQALMVRLGMTALARIRDAFVTRSRGLTDEAGLAWPPLSPATIAYSRRHPQVLWPGRLRAPYAPSWMLTPKQRVRWWQLASVGGPAYAWIITKAEGGKTLIGVYGSTQVDILRDTGLLLNSLSPGLFTGKPLPGPEFIGPQPNPGEANQVFRLARGEVVIGTNRKYASSHHYGIPGRIPQRRLWPAPSTWPQTWWDDIASQARQGLIDVAIFMLQRSA